MKLFAQAGFQAGDKVEQGLREGIIGGAIFSPKDLLRETLGRKFVLLRRDFPEAEILFDPQFYVSLYAALPMVNPGNLSDWDSYFRTYRKSELEVAANVDSVLSNCFSAIQSLPVTAVIAPNIFVSNSLDSREAVIAKNFVRQAREVFARTGDTRPLFCTIAISRETLLDRREFEEFVNDLTLLEQPPDGFYLIIGARSTDARSDIFHVDVLVNWMLLNHSLAVNGFRVINGYSDLVTPLLGAVGAEAGATGWFSDVRTFSIDRFFPVGGGRQPIPRYLTTLLLNRITFSEKDAISRFVPEVLNNLRHDADYAPEPDRAAEVLQSWEALKSLLVDLVVPDVRKSLDGIEEAVDRATEAYARIARVGIPLDAKSRSDHLTALHDAIDEFRDRAGLGTPTRPA